MFRKFLKSLLSRSKYKTIMMMKYGIFLLAILFIAMNGCESSKVADFNKSLERSERKAFQIIVGKEGSENKKLKCLGKGDYKGAIAAVEQQAVEFDSLIANIRKLSTEGIPDGEPLKTASIAYYQSLKELHFFDRKEIEQQALIQTLKNEERNTSQNTLISLARKKKMLYNKVYEKEALLQTATENFNASNGF